MDYAERVLRYKAGLQELTRLLREVDQEVGDKFEQALIYVNECATVGRMNYAEVQGRIDMDTVLTWQLTDEGQGYWMRLWDEGVDTYTHDHRDVRQGKYRVVGVKLPAVEEAVF